MKVAINLVLSLSAVGALSQTGDMHCNQMIGKLCKSVPSGDVRGAVHCLEANADLLAKKDCAFPEEIMDLFKEAIHDPVNLASDLASSEFAARIENFGTGHTVKAKKKTHTENSALPIVLAHGMGDSCFNPGMAQITSDAGAHVGAYSVCIPTGDTQAKDTINGFLLNMDKSVDVFAAKIQADEKLAGGFNAIGLSQGNSLIRGYIHKYNDPPVKNVLHIHGTVSGVSGFPNCNPDGLLAKTCKAVSKICGKIVYNELVQGILFQANYFRDPTRVNTTEYQTHSQLAQWNGEGEGDFNTTFRDNFISVDKYVMVKADKDSMVFPNDGEWWGHYADGDSYKAITMNQTKWYAEDTFGLKSVDKQNKLFYEETNGNHLRFTEEELFGWIDKYF